MHFGNKSCGLIRLKWNILVTICKDMVGKKDAEFNEKENLSSC